MALTSSSLGKLLSKSKNRHNNTLHTEPRAARVFPLPNRFPRPGERGRYVAKATLVVIDPREIKATNERIITDAGGKICDWLPHLEERTPRDRSDIVGRSLVLNAMLQIAFEAPTHVIRTWIEEHSLSQHLSPTERELLSKDNEELTQQEKTDLYWYIEALWALMWVGSLIDELDFEQPIQDYMANLCPKLQDNEDGSKFDDTMQIRPYADLFQMLDLHFRLHWWTRDGNLRGYETGNVSLDIIMERRKALEWALDKSSHWDNIELNT